TDAKDSTDDSTTETTVKSTSDSATETTTDSTEDATPEETEKAEPRHPYTIPKGSLVFTGSYKGNPAYNVVILYDEKGKIVGGFDEEGSLLSEQIILADVPEEGDITNVSSGTWIYWIEPEYLENMNLPEKVRVELYRVNDALTNEGQRLVSDSLFEELNAKDISKLPTITFGSGEDTDNADDTDNVVHPVVQDQDQDQEQAKATDNTSENVADTTSAGDDKDKDKAKNDNTDSSNPSNDTTLNKDKDKEEAKEEKSSTDTEA
ncbi:MAG: hypothetical protein K2O42_02915, partial [Oscillospiraceae bacterium]|nr:hypothetical protein [Oscillospiraceae bacterium]